MEEEEEQNVEIQQEEQEGDLNEISILGVKKTLKKMRNGKVAGDDDFLKNK